MKVLAERYEHFMLKTGDGHSYLERAAVVRENAAVRYRSCILSGPVLRCGLFTLAFAASKDGD